ncbi:hypothetical protein ACO0LG_29300 [Undibacterium sp. Ji42W]|uniref:hypothetical protein n=1 Tax=Undibacterium sp. Ji42W TaxID=3413039 RepID=UPI003BF17D09
MTKNEEDLRIFVQDALNEWSDVYAGNAKSANARIRAAEKMVTRWAKEGVVLELLLPLLKHEAIAVRFAAAAHLINHGGKKHAVAVLRELVKEPSLIASSADAVLRINKISINSDL